MIADLLKERDFKYPVFFGFDTMDTYFEGHLGDRLFSLSIKNE